MPPQHCKRKSCRLSGFDYAQAGLYFVTVVTQARECLFGEVIEGEAVLTPFGEMMRACWAEIPEHFPTVQLDTFVVMPNHLHGIVRIPVGATHASPANVASADGSPANSSPAKAAPGNGVHGTPSPAKAATIDAAPVVCGPRSRATHASPLQGAAGPGRGSLGAIVGAFKSASARRINELRGTPGMVVWQRGFHDHIIRRAEALDRIRRYILDNPTHWPTDHDNPDRPPKSP